MSESSDKRGIYYRKRKNPLQNNQPNFPLNRQEYDTK